MKLTVAGRLGGCVLTPEAAAQVLIMFVRSMFEYEQRPIEWEMQVEANEFPIGNKLTFCARRDGQTFIRSVELFELQEMASEPYMALYIVAKDVYLHLRWVNDEQKMIESPEIRGQQVLPARLRGLNAGHRI